MRYAIVQTNNVYYHLFTGTLSECMEKIKEMTFITCKIVTINQ